MGALMWHLICLQPWLHAMGRVNCNVSMVLALKNREHIAYGMTTGFLLTQWLHSPSHGSSLWQKCCLDLSSGTLIA